MPFHKNEIRVLIRHEARDKMPLGLKSLPAIALRARISDLRPKSYILHLIDLDIGLQYKTLGDIAADWLWYQPETPIDLRSLPIKTT